MTEIEKYYNKFNEDKRLLSRHGIVEYTVCNKYIHEVIGDKKNLKIADIGAGTGRYSIPLSEEGHEVTAIEPVKKNLSYIKMRSKKVIAKQGGALKIKEPDESFDIVILFGPLYHLITHEEKLQALNEAKRIVKKNGYIFTMYISNEYAVISYAFKEGKLRECINSGKLDSEFNTITDEKDLYSYVRLEEINRLTNEAGLTREKIIGVDGATDYIRPVINKLSEEDFKTYIEYQLKICERFELIGASSHIMEILKK